MLTDAQRSLLTHIVREADRGFGARPSKSPERDALQRKGLIVSSRTNPIIARATSGKVRRWRPTEAGRAALSASTSPAHGEGMK